MKILSSSIAKFFAIGALVGALAAGEGRTNIAGRVTDPQGQSIAGASLALYARGGDARSNTTSNSSGSYRFEAVAPGEYILQVEAPGFSRFVTETVNVQRGAELTLEISLQLARVQQQVVVTASSTPQTADEISKSVSVIDSQSIDERDKFALPDVLRFTPGLRVQQLGGPGSFTAVRMRGLRNQDTAVLLDGLRFRDASATQADASGLLEDLIVTDIDRVEVLRGSGSSLYGTNAIGGVINVIGNEGGGRMRGNLLLEGGSLGMFRGRAQLSGGLSRDGIQYSAGLAHLNVTSGVDGDDPARNTSGQGRIAFHLSPNMQLVARLYSVDSFVKLNLSPRTAVNLPAAGIIDAVPVALPVLHQYETGTPLARLMFGNGTFIPSADDPDSTRGARFYAGALMLMGQPSPDLGYTVSYQGLAASRVFGNGPAGVGFQPLGSTRSDYDSRIQTVNAHLDYRLAGFNLVSGGYEFEDENFANQSLDRLNPAAASSADVTQRSHAIFAQDQVRLFGDRLQLSGAFRAQWFVLQRPIFSPAAAAPYAGVAAASSPAAYTGDGSAAYFVRKTGTKIRAHAGRGYRSPSLYERFGTGFDPDFGYSVYGDPRLRPEHSIAVDAGIDQSFFNRRLRASATYFYTRLQEVILFDFTGFIKPATDPFGRFGGYRNAQGGIARGVELSGILSATRTLDVSASYTYTNARERTPIIENVLRSFIVPTQQFTLIATQRIGKRLSVDFDLAASGDYLGQIFGTRARAYRFPGIHKADIGANYRMPLSDSRTVRLFGKVDNVFNQNYYESGFRTPGRTAIGGLQFEF